MVELHFIVSIKSGNLEFNTPEKGYFANISKGADFKLEKSAIKEKKYIRQMTRNRFYLVVFKGYMFYYTSFLGYIPCKQYVRVVHRYNFNNLYNMDKYVVITIIK